MRKFILGQISTDSTGIFKLPGDPIERQEKLEDFADIFMEAYNRAQQHQ